MINLTVQTPGMFHPYATNPIMPQQLEPFPSMYSTPKKNKRSKAEEESENEDSSSPPPQIKRKSKGKKSKDKKKNNYDSLDLEHHDNSDGV